MALLLLLLRLARLKLETEFVWLSQINHTHCVEVVESRRAADAVERRKMFN